MKVSIWNSEFQMGDAMIPLDPTPNLIDQVYARILEGIADHSLPPGQRIRQADAMGEFALGEVLREIIAQEQEHLQDLADALGIDTQEIEG